MRVLSRLISIVDRTNEHMGVLVSWITLAMILVVTYNVFMRYALNRPTTWSFDMNYMLGGAMIALGMGFVMKHRENVRIDVLSSRFSEKTRIWIDVVFGLLLFAPIFFLIARVYWLDFANAVRIGEKSLQSSWYPPLWPFKLTLAVGFTLLFIQGVANAVHDLAFLITGEQHD